MNSCISQNDFPESWYVRFFVSELVVGDFYFQVFFSPKLIFEFLIYIYIYIYIIGYSWLTMFQHCNIQLLLFSHPVVSDSLQPHGRQHARPPCPSPTPGVCPSSCPLHRWCHPAISSSNILLPLLFPSIRVFSNKSAVIHIHIYYFSYYFPL